MTALILLIIIIACVAYQYLKGSLLAAVVLIITTICSAIAAFAYYETLASLLIPYIGQALMPWARFLCFILLFIITLAVLQTIASKIIRKSVELDPIPERLGRCLCGAICGFIITGLLLTAAAMAPLPEKFPYRRFESAPNPQNPNKAMFNPDGFLCGLFGLVSRGSMSGKTSFAVMHPSLIDELFLNRYIPGRSALLVTEKNAVNLPSKAAWLAPDTLKNKDGTNITQKTGHSLTVIRVGIKTNARVFTTAQLRLICKEKTENDNPLKGKAVNIYPLGYISAKDRLETKRLNELVSPTSSASTGSEKLIDFVFEVPDNYTPVLIALKQSSIARVPKLISTEQAPSHVPF